MNRVLWPAGVRIATFLLSAILVVGFVSGWSLYYDARARNAYLDGEARACRAMISPDVNPATIASAWDRTWHAHAPKPGVYLKGGR